MSEFDAREMNYVHEEKLVQPGPSSTRFVVELTASGVVGQGTAESIPELDKEEDQS